MHEFHPMKLKCMNLKDVGRHERKTSYKQKIVLDVEKVSHNTYKK